MKRTVVLTLLLVLATMSFAQSEVSDSSDVKQNQLDVSLQMLGHGEMRFGGFDATESNNDDMNKAYFMMQRTRLVVDYKRPNLETRVNVQHKGIWGQKGQGSLNLYEAWAKLSKNGLFAQIGRQALSYDDERIIGPNDWAMAALSHDVLKMGYEGHGHKAHVILGFNQNAENTYGGTYYADGAQPYKTMMTAWYHYDVPKIPLGASLLFMNIGMQGGKQGGKGDDEPHDRYQQLIGGYLSYHPSNFKAEASYYRQMGRTEDNTKIKAWMASVKAQWTINQQFSTVAGYDYLSGDKYFAVPVKGFIGLVQHDVIRGFNPIYGSHHKFYGMMDFFYVKTYHNGFTPGLQNLYAGFTYSPLKDLRLKATYHYMATATRLDAIDMTLGHDVDLEASYRIMKDVNLSAGFSYMIGTESMERLKRADDSSRLRWGWFSLVITPKLFTTKW